MILIVMGVSASGKTTIGERLAAALAWPFFDADDFHPEANVAKMRAGIPLNDADRKPWLEALAEREAQLLAEGRSAVIACSALKARYRAILRAPAGEKRESVRFIYLKISEEVARRRIHHRRGHFMPAELVASQFTALEEPQKAMAIDGTQSPDEVVRKIREALKL